VSAYPEVGGPDPAQDPALASLLLALRRRHHDAVCGVLLYGSCLRSGELGEGILDLYLVCDGYRAAYGRLLPAVANRLLPPNVFYVEHTEGERTLRAKVAVVSLRDFRRACSSASFESYFWGRFAQPTRVLYARNEDVGRLLQSALLEASRTLLARALPALPESGSLEDLWRGALALSYATELRSERQGRSAELAQFARQFYAAVSRHHAPWLGLELIADASGGLTYSSHCGPARRCWARAAWFLRRVQGKTLSVARLLKALFTFEGALDYLAWKLSRHSGEEILIPERVRRAPLLFIWGFCWGLYRRGVFR